MPYKVLCDDHACCFDIRQDEANMSLWISGHEKYNGKVSTIGEGLLAAKESRNDSQGISIHDV